LAAQGSEAPPSLRLRDIAGSALRAGRKRFARVAVAALVVYAVLGLASALIGSLVTPPNSWPQIVCQIALSTANVFGVTFLGGFFGRAVGASEHGLPQQTAWQVLRTQPYGRLIRADLLVSTACAIGFLLLIVPGFVVFTLLALTGPAIKFERRAGISALRRSAHIVRPHFWTVAALVTVPLVVGSAITSGVPELVSDPLPVSFVVRLVVEGTVAAICGLMQSELGYRLLAVTKVKETTAVQASSSS
jgi:hypothetical protein